MRPINAQAIPIIADEAVNLGGILKITHYMIVWILR